jgi:hypothetical protein
MNNDTCIDRALPDGRLPTLHRYIGKTLRVSARHLPWAMAKQIHSEHQAGETCGAFPSTGGLLILELDDYCWRADVTADNIAAAQALDWPELRRLLRLAQACECEALELADDYLTLPAVLDFEVFA